MLQSACFIFIIPLFFFHISFRSFPELSSSQHIFDIHFDKIVVTAVPIAAGVIECTAQSATAAAAAAAMPQNTQKFVSYVSLSAG